MLSVVVPAYNEGVLIENTLNVLHQILSSRGIQHEIIVVYDHSTDDTVAVVNSLLDSITNLKLVENKGVRGYGAACKTGIDEATGESVAIFMADLSDSPEDLVLFYGTLNAESCDMVFGNRWTGKMNVEGYPVFKRIVNRLANHFVALLFGLRYYDITNGFKLYRKYVLDSLKPFKANQFNLALELPLRAVNAGYKYKVVKNSWKNYKPGKSNFKLMDMFCEYWGTLSTCCRDKYFKKR